MPQGLHWVYPAFIVTVTPRKQWTVGTSIHLSGTIESIRLDVPALGLTPLQLADVGPWDPGDEYWGDDEDSIDEWARQIIAWGPRRAYEMEQVLPGADPDDFHSDPILDSIDRKEMGDFQGARRILMDMCEATCDASMPTPTSAI